ncbi:hypothetical protein [Maritalea sp.]|uniref:hypothetical protein n=1 Tax=Maritalea sp. TaxID=2003361 RepID=UPI003EF88932
MAFTNRIIISLSILAGFLPGIGHAQSVPDTKLSDQNYEHSVFAFSGRFHSGYFGASFTLPINFEDNYIVGVGYQRFLDTDPNGWNLGLELGLAGRLGANSSAEVWGGGVVRYDGWILGDTWRVSPSLTAGISVVSDTIGVEKTREAAAGQLADILFYLAPEISVSNVDNPQYEIFTRVQHRSGLWGLTGFTSIDGSNAIAAGFRYKY